MLDNTWEVIKSRKGYFKKELNREINKKHILHGIELKEIPRREYCYYILFLLLDGSNRYRVVYLTWSEKKKIIHDTLEQKFMII